MTLRIDNASVNSAHWAAAGNGAGMWNGVSGLTQSATMMNGSYGNFNLYAVDFTAWGINNNAPGYSMTYDASWNAVSWPTTTHANAQVFLNNTWKWHTNGSFNQAGHEADVTTVAGHEVGHDAGLNHPWGCHTMCCDEPASVMNADFTQKWAINADDIGGLNVFY